MTVQAKAHVGEGAELGNGSVIGQTVRVDAEEKVEDDTVLFMNSWEQGRQQRCQPPENQRHHLYMMECYRGILTGSKSRCNMAGSHKNIATV